MITYDASLVAEMREWLEDCGIGTAQMKMFEVIRAVRREYQGGIDQFVADTRELFGGREARWRYFGRSAMPWEL